MANIKSKNTRPEKIVRSILHKMGYRFRLNVNSVIGKPDIVLRRHQRIIFVHGCFWHGHKGCKRSKLPTGNANFWKKKINGNIARDKKVMRELKKQGWSVLIVWQCQLKDLDKLQKRLRSFMES